MSLSSHSHHLSDALDAICRQQGLTASCIARSSHYRNQPKAQRVARALLSGQVIEEGQLTLIAPGFGSSSAAVVALVQAERRIQSEASRVRALELKDALRDAQSLWERFLREYLATLRASPWRLADVPVLCHLPVLDSRVGILSLGLGQLSWLWANDLLTHDCVCGSRAFVYRIVGSLTSGRVAHGQHCGGCGLVHQWHPQPWPAVMREVKGLLAAEPFPTITPDELQALRRIPAAEAIAMVRRQLESTGR